MKWQTLWMVACSLFASLPRGHPDTTRHAFVGETVVLPCTSTAPAELDISQLRLYWQIESVVVHFFHQGHDDLEFQDERYHGRTSLFLDEVKHGNFSLKLSNVQLQDAAVYSCIYRQSESQQTKKPKIKLDISDPPSTGEEHSHSEQSQIPSRSPTDAQHPDVLLSFYLLVALGIWHL